jgi:hypothetical protein
VDNELKMDVEGSNCGLFHVISWHLSGDAEKNHEKTG